MKASILILFEKQSSLSCLRNSHPFHQATFSSKFKTVVYNDFPSKMCSPRVLSHWSLQPEIFKTVSNVSCVIRCLKGKKPIESEDSTPSRLVLIPCLVTGGEKRFFHKLSTFSCISVLVISMLAASRGGGPMSLLPIHLSIHPMTHTVI